MWQIVLNGPGYLDTEYELPDGETVLGRADDNDIVLSGDLVSRRHACFVRDLEGVTVDDAGSRNGTKVNGQKINGVTRLTNGDVINIGENRISLRRLGSAALEARTEIATSPGSPHPEGRAELPRLFEGGNPGETSADLAALPFDPPAPPPPAAPALTAPVLLRQEVAGTRALADIEKARALGASELLNDKDVHPELAALVLLYQVSERLASAPSIERFLEDVCELVADVACARTVVALLRDADGGMAPVAVRHRGSSLAQGEVPISNSIVEESVRTRTLLAVADVGRDSRFSGKESVVLYGVSQVICVPLWQGNDVAGVLYATRDGREGPELSRLVEALTAIGHLAASGLEQQRLRQRAAEEARVRKVLERFHAPDIVDRVVKDFAESGGPRMEERLATILFADISGFTEMTERLPPATIVKLLDEFYRRMTSVVFSFGGTVDKFIGDCVMAIFGAPYPRGDDPARAVRAAMAMRVEFMRMMESRPKDEQSQINIGINTGRVLVGTVGGEGRLEYTAVGDSVNVASRLVGGAKPGQVVISGSTLRYLDGRFHVQPLGERQLKGRRESVAVYEVEDEDLSASTMPGTRSGM